METEQGTVASQVHLYLVQKVRQVFGANESWERSDAEQARAAGLHLCLFVGPRRGGESGAGPGPILRYSSPRPGQRIAVVYGRRPGRGQVLSFFDCVGSPMFFFWGGGGRRLISPGDRRGRREPRYSLTAVVTRSRSPWAGLFWAVAFSGSGRLGGRRGSRLQDGPQR